MQLNKQPNSWTDKNRRLPHWLNSKTNAWLETITFFQKNQPTSWKKPPQPNWQTGWQPELKLSKQASNKLSNTTCNTPIQSPTGSNPCPQTCLRKCNGIGIDCCMILSIRKSATNNPDTMIHWTPPSIKPNWNNFSHSSPRSQWVSFAKDAPTPRDGKGALKRDISSYSRDKCVILSHCYSVICNFTRDTNELITESNPKGNKLSNTL